MTRRYGNVLMANDLEGGRQVEVCEHATVVFMSWGLLRGLA